MLHGLNMKSLLTAVAMCLVIVGQAAAQSVKAQQPIIVDGSNSETTKSELDLLAQTAGNNDVIILVARLSDKESSRKINQRRLHSVSTYLKAVRAIPEQRIVTAESNPVRGLGRVEAYLCNKLFMVFTLERNKDFAGEQ